METLYSFGDPPEPERSPLDQRFDLIAEWTTEDDEAFELYADGPGGDGCLLHIPRRPQAETIDSIYHAGGVLRGVVWSGFACDRSASWRAVLRRRIAAKVASWHAEHPL
ncbi:hypothetical protein GCM10029992_52960 [Glycomyces albus]